MKVRILVTLSVLPMAKAAVVPATSFPDDGTTGVFVSADSLATFRTSNFFSVQGDFVGDGGGSGNLTNAFNGAETLTLELASGAGLSGFGTRWTNSTIVITGFESDPGAAISVAGTASWDETTRTLSLAMVWDSGAGRTITLANPQASAGRTLEFSFNGGQTAFTSFSHESDDTPAATPLVHLTFDDSAITATTVADQSGNANDATIVASATAPTAGQSSFFGQSFAFAGGDDPAGIVTLPAGVLPSGSEARTYSFWFNQANVSGQNKIFGSGGTTAGTALDLGLESGGIRLRHYGGNILFGNGFDFAGTDSGWHHVALRVNEGATTFADVDVFLDGLPLPPQPGGATTVAINTLDTTFAIGSTSIAAAAQGFDGLLDEFKAWDSPLTNVQIFALAERPPFPEIISFSSSPQNRVPAGTSVTLSWEAINASSLTLEPGGIDVTGQTSVVVNPTAKTTYTLTASDNVPNTVTARTTVAVGEEPFPNIIVFFLDDFGWADWQQNGASTGSVFYETPNMNRMAAEGLYFTDGYASTPVCSPTRGALMSGQSPAYNKLTDWISGRGDAGQVVREAEWVKELPVDLPNWPRVLSDCGYRSIHVGKWHLGEGSDPAANPLNHGFDINIGGNQFGTPPAPERYFASANGFSALPNLGPEVAPSGSYLTDVLTEQAVAQIKDAAVSDTAFAMYLSHYAVHTPIQAPAATVAKYQAKLANNPGTNWQGHTNPTYAAMIEHVDRSLGAILDTLADPDGNPATDDSIADNTLVVLTADNGGLLSSTSNRPLRNGKGGTYDGGIREPWIFWQPGKIQPGICHEPIVTHDLFPTLLAQAGVDSPAGHVVNGQDLSPLLAGEGFKREKPLVFHYPHWSPADQVGEPYSAVRKGDWKLIYIYADKSWHLYNLADNIGETNNLAASRPDHYAVLSWLLANGLEELDANYCRNVPTLAEEPPVPLVRPDVDSDGDGQSDFDEAVQGTDGDDRTSYFRAPTINPGGPGNGFSFPPVAERSYVLEASPDLTPASWVVIDDTLPLADGSDLLEKRFYRLRTDFP